MNEWMIAILGDGFNYNSLSSNINSCGKREMHVSLRLINLWGHTQAHKKPNEKWKIHGQPNPSRQCNLLAVIPTKPSTMLECLSVYSVYSKRKRYTIYVCECQGFEIYFIYTSAFLSCAVRCLASYFDSVNRCTNSLWLFWIWWKW